MNNSKIDNAMSLLARLIFASTLLLFFWKSAGTKFDGWFTPSVGAYGQIFPKAFEAVGADTSQLSIFHTLIALAGAYAEYILPAMIVIGLLTRLASLGMIGFIAVMSWVDVFGHGVSAGKLFDRQAYDIIADQRLFWLFLLIVLTVKGGGWLSLDKLFLKRFSHFI